MKEIFVLLSLFHSVRGEFVMQLRCSLLLAFIVGLMQSALVVQAQQPELPLVLKKLDELEQTLNSLVCSGHYSFGKQVNFDFCVRSELVKQIEEEKEGTVVSLWNNKGHFVIRRPKGGNWSLAAMEKPGSKSTKTIAPIKFEALSIIANKLPALLRSDDYTVLSLELDQNNPDLVKLRLKYNPGMDSYDWKTPDSEKKPPVFDEATVYLDRTSGYRIKGYLVQSRCRCAAERGIRVGVLRNQNTRLRKRRPYELELVVFLRCLRVMLRVRWCSFL